MENIDNVKAFIQNLNHSVDELEPALEKLLSKSLNERVSEVSSLDKIKLTNSYTYILSSLLFAYLKTKGVDTNSHDIMAELNKCKSYMKRLKDLETVDVQKKEQQDLADRFIKTKLLSGNSTVVTGLQQPAISRVSFEGKHTKFKDESDDDDKEHKKPIPSKTGKLGKITKPTSRKDKTAKKTKKKNI